MKKKILPIVALSAILSLGVGSLASCGENTSTPEPEQQQPEKVEVNVYHYGVSLVSEKGVSLTSDKATAKKGETVKVTATVAKGATLRGLVCEGLTFTKVADETAWTFVMPEKSVRITVDADAPVIPPEKVEVEVEVNHYGISLVNEKGITLTSDKISAKKGETVTITATVAKGATLRGLASEGIEFTKVADADYTWTFVMPEKSVRITVDADAPVIPPVKEEVEIHHYAILWTDVEGVTVTAPDEAKVGEKVTITTAVADGAAFTLTGLDASAYGVEIVAGETAGTWTFEMPEHKVEFKLITETIKNPITITGVDDTKATIAVLTDKNDPKSAVTEAAPGQTLYIKSTLATDSTTDVGSITLNGKPLSYIGYGKYWSLTMPETGPCELVVSYPTPTSIDETNTLFKTSHWSSPNTETAEYSITIKQGWETLQPSEGTLSWPTSANAEYTIEIFAEGRPAHKITSCKLGEVEVTLTEDGAGGYTGTFTTTETPSALTFITEDVPVVASHTITEDVMSLGDLTNYDGTPELIYEDETIDLYYSSDSGATVDVSKSGAFDSTDTLVAPFVFDDESGSYKLTLTGIKDDITIKAVIGTAFEIEGVAGGWRCAESFGGIKNNSIKITKDGNYELRTNTKEVTTGTLLPAGPGSYMDSQGALVAELVDGIFLVTSMDPMSGEIKDAIPFLPVDDFGGLTDKASVKDAEIPTTLARVSDTWFIYDDAGARKVTANKTSLVKDEIISVTDGETTTAYRYDGTNLILPGIEAGTYTGHTSSVTLDGHGHWGDEDHTYVYNDFLGIIDMKEVDPYDDNPYTNTQEYKYDIDVETKTLSEHTATTDALSGKAFTFTTLDTNATYPEETTFKFENSDNVTVKKNGNFKNAEYKFDGTILTIKIKGNICTNISTWTYDATTETLKWASGNVEFNHDVDNTVVAKLSQITGTFTPADASVTGNLVLDKWGKAKVNGGASSVYTLDYAEKTITIGEITYTVDWASKTYSIPAPKTDYTFVNNQTYTLSKVEDAMIGEDGSVWGEALDVSVTIVFGDAGKVTSLTIEQIDGDSYDATTTNLSESNLDYTIDEAGLMTITVGTKTIKLQLDANKQTIKSSTSKWNGLPTTEGSTFDFEVGTGVFTHKA